MTYDMKRKCFCALALSATVALAVFADGWRNAQERREIERSGSVFHSYEFEPVVDTPAPEGYKPFYVAHYGRHGSRRLTDSFVADTLAAMEKAEASAALTEKGKALLADVRKIADAHDGMIGQLTERGAEEHRLLARRMAERFPQVFVGSRRVRCQSSVYPRVLVSQANFTMSLKGAAPGLEFDFAAGDKIQKVIHGAHWAWKGAKKGADVNKATGDYAKSAIDPKPLVRRLFLSDGAAGDELKFARNLFACASICQCLRTELAGLDIYRYFANDEIAALGRALAVGHYAKMGASKEFGDTLLRCLPSLARDFAERAEEAIADGRIAADLRFGHDNGLWPFVGFLEIVGPGNRVPFADSWRECPAWKWMPMASNLQIVLYAREGRGSRDRNDVLVKILYNEREMAVGGLKPVSSGVYYAWKDLAAKLDQKSKTSL